MPRFCANLSMLFTEVAFLERFASAARAGFEAVEYLFPYEYPKEALAKALDGNGLRQVLFNFPAGDWAKGERGLGAVPGREEEFRAGVAKAIDYAKALQCGMINCLAGIPPTGVGPEAARATLVANVRYAAPLLKDAGIKLVMEPINNFDIPGFWLNRVGLAAALIEEAGSDNLFIQYDLYHQQRSEGELIGNFKRHQAKIAHMQLADNPGRNEPGTGEINYPFVFEELDRAGYQGWIGCEYKPKGATEAGLGWAAGYLKRRV
jgi:hydroxypyruvate isomerase